MFMAVFMEFMRRLWPCVYGRCQKKVENGHKKGDFGKRKRCRLGDTGMERVGRTGNCTQQTRSPGACKQKQHELLFFETQQNQRDGKGSGTWNRKPQRSTESCSLRQGPPRPIHTMPTTKGSKAPHGGRTRGEPLVMQGKATKGKKHVHMHGEMSSWTNQR